MRLGWFASQPAGLLTATDGRGQRTDLLTVPPDASERDAQAAMEQAAQAGNRSHTPALLAAVTPLDSPAGHVAMVSHPDDVTQLIETAAEAVQTAR